MLRLPPVPPFRVASVANLTGTLTATLALALCGCLFDDPAPGPTIQGHFGKRLEGLPLAAVLDSSAKALEMMRERSGDSYTYRVSYGGPLSGSDGYVETTVRGGVAVSRETFSRPRDPAQGPATRKTETAADLAALPSSEAPRTLPALYAECRELLSKDPARGTPYFSYDGNYILEQCSFREEGIADWMPEISIRMRNWAWK